MASIIVKDHPNVTKEYREHYSTRVGAGDGDPYAFTAQILNLASPRVREAFSDLQRDIHEQHERGLNAVWDRITSGRTGFRAIGALPPPTNPLARASTAQRRQFQLPEGFAGLIEHVRNPDRLQDAFIFCDGDIVQVMTYGAQGGREIPAGKARISTTCTLQLDGGQDAFHVFPPAYVTL